MNAKSSLLTVCLISLSFYGGYMVGKVDNTQVAYSEIIEMDKDIVEYFACTQVCDEKYNPQRMTIARN